MAAAARGGAHFTPVGRTRTGATQKKGPRGPFEAGDPFPTRGAAAPKNGEEKGRRFRFEFASYYTKNPPGPQGFPGVFYFKCMELSTEWKAAVEGWAKTAKFYGLSGKTTTRYGGFLEKWKKFVKKNKKGVDRGKSQAL